MLRSVIGVHVVRGLGGLLGRLGNEVGFELLGLGTLGVEELLEPLFIRIGVLGRLRLPSLGVGGGFDALVPHTACSDRRCSGRHRSTVALAFVQVAHAASSSTAIAVRLAVATLALDAHPCAIVGHRRTTTRGVMIDEAGPGG